MKRNRSRIYYRQRNIFEGRPDHAAPETDVAAMAGNSQGNRIGNFARMNVDARQRAIALIEGPDCAGACRKESRVRTAWYGCYNCAWSRIDRRYFRAFCARD